MSMEASWRLLAVSRAIFWGSAQTLRLDSASCEPVVSEWQCEHLSSPGRMEDREGAHTEDIQYARMFQ
eukprot:5795856-Pyramimonas_sp.AAC.1